MTLHIDKDRLWSTLMDMAAISATAKGGCNRQALTDPDIEARTLFAAWCKAEGMAVRYDAMGNMFARLEGVQPDLAPLVIGSHLDTQPTGGKFDGVLGVLAALEVVRCLRAAGITPQCPIEIANWMNEEGARFAPAMMGSGVFAGMLDLAETRRATDQDGITLGDELDRHGYSSEPDPRVHEMHAYLELHIEQGPVLEARGTRIGVVTGAQGIRWYDLTLTGQEVHAGPTPMHSRKDPVAALPGLIDGMLDLASGDDAARVTIGQLSAAPGSRNVVPGEVSLSLDLRHPDEARLTAMHEALTALFEKTLADHPDLGGALHQIWHSPVVTFDDRLLNAIRKGADAHGIDHMNIVSGAGHDALMVARRVPTAMIFTPCRDGISHNEAEHIEPEQAEDGANVLLAAVLDLVSEPKDHSDEHPSYANA